jgi:hypothetical protein
MLKNIFVASLLVAFSGLAAASPGVRYEVKITNVTPAQAFTPQLVVTHEQGAHLFVLGDAADPALEALAEGGRTDLLEDTVADSAYDMQTSAGLLMPGETTTLILVAHPKRGLLSLAAMLLPTNDTFVGLDAVPLPTSGSPATYMLAAYDAGTEYNDQLCANIPGPLCQGEAFSLASESDEGFVHVGNGFHEMGEEALSPRAYGWGSSVAKVEVTRLRGK